MSPQRIQLRRTRGWRKPAGAVVVSRPSKWGNPFRLGVAQVRMPALDGHAWEYEGRLYKTSGQREAYNHADGHYSWHQIEYATPGQILDLYLAYVRGGGWPLDYTRPSMVETIRAELGGRDLCCWCRLDSACHADVLLEIANARDGAE